MVAVSADDYAWFTEQCAELADAYSLTLVRGRTPGEVIEQLDGRDANRSVGLGRLPEQAAARGGRIVAAAALDGWTLVFEPRSATAGRSGRLLSRGTVLVSHSTDLFLWARDGEVLLEFDPADAGRRGGSDPDGLVEVLDRLGFDTASEDARDGWGDEARYRERSSALAEQLTGVPVTLAALEAATFTCATLPGHDEAGQAVPVAAETRRSSGLPAEPRRAAAKPEKWDEEYDAPIDDDWSDADSDDDGEEDGEEREWPRLLSRVRRALTPRS